MASAAERALHKAIKSRSFEPAYYFHGDDDLLKDAAVRQLVAAVVDAASRDFNLDVRRGADLDGETIGVLLNTPPMMADRRAVVVRDAGAMRKDARAVVDAYLGAPSPGVVLVLVTPAGAKPEKPWLSRTMAVEFQPLSEERLPRWIVHYASTELGATITPTAAELLQSAVGSDLPQIAAELDKLASYVSGAAGAVIDEDAVTAVVGVRRGETLGDLLDKVAARDAAGALDLVPHVLAQPKTSAVTVVMALGTQMLALAWGLAMREQGTRAPDFFALLRDSGGAYTGRPWGEAATAWTRALDGWSLPALDRALDLLLQADAALKETRLSSDEQLLSSLVLALCALDVRGRESRSAA